MASAIVSPTLVPRDASVTQKTRAETRLSGRNGKFRFAFENHRSSRSIKSIKRCVH